MEIYRNKEMISIAFKCIVKSIKSCQTIEQLQSSRNLLDNYQNNFYKSLYGLDIFKQVRIIKKCDTETRFRLIKNYIKARRMEINNKN